jgi:hypothetical protein
MSEHEDLHEEAVSEADRLEGENERVGEDIEAAREARDRAASDELIATEAPQQGSDHGDQPVADLTNLGDSQDDDGPPPEVTYTSKE